MASLSFLTGLCFCLISFYCSHAVLYSNAPGGKAMMFSNKYNGLAWPINKATDLSNAVWHGAHCVAKVKECATINITNPSEYHHVEHCRQHVKDAITFFETNTNYTVHPMICDDLRDLYKEYKHILVLPMIGDFQYNGTEVPDENGQVAQNGYQALLQKHPEIVGNDDIFNIVAAVNSGNIRTKAMNNYSLTKEESEHMTQWHSDRTNRLASLGLFCIIDEGKKAPIETLKKIIAVPCKGH